jgi:pimeloyl-ACP methyl ester carboxylesterase
VPENRAAVSTTSIFGDERRWADIWVRSGWLVQECTLNDRYRLLDPRDRLVLQGSRADCLAAGSTFAPSDGNKRAAILMHGLGRSRRSMNRIEQALVNAGWRIANLGYPSRLRPIESHAEQARGVAQALVDDGAVEVSFIGYSLGGLVGRLAMAKGWPKGRAVLIGTPNNGAQLADRLNAFSIFRHHYGPCGWSVGTAGTAKIPIPDVEIAVMAGGNGRYGFNPFLSDDNDGIVTIPETRLPGAEAGFLVTRSIHRALPIRRDVIAATLAFLATGRVHA